MQLFLKSKEELRQHILDIHLKTHNLTAIQLKDYIQPTVEVELVGFIINVYENKINVLVGSQSSRDSVACVLYADEYPKEKLRIFNKWDLIKFRGSYTEIISPKDINEDYNCEGCLYAAFNLIEILPVKKTTSTNSGCVSSILIFLIFFATLWLRIIF